MYSWREAQFTINIVFKEPAGSFPAYLGIFFLLAAQPKESAKLSGVSLFAVLVTTQDTAGGLVRERNAPCRRQSNFETAWNLRLKLENESFHDELMI